MVQKDSPCTRGNSTQINTNMNNTNALLGEVTVRDAHCAITLFHKSVKNKSHLAMKSNNYAGIFDHQLAWITAMFPPLCIPFCIMAHSQWDQVTLVLNDNSQCIDIFSDSNELDIEKRIPYDQVHDIQVETDAYTSKAAAAQIWLLMSSGGRRDQERVALFKKMSQVEAVQRANALKQALLQRVAETNATPV